MVTVRIMECLRSGGYYNSTKEYIPEIYGSYFYSITYLTKKCADFNIYTIRGLVVKTNPSVFFSNMSEQYNDMIIDYIIYIDDWGDLNKTVLSNYSKMLSYINIKWTPEPYSIYITDKYNRPLAITELLHIKSMLKKTPCLRLVFLNTNITNLYGL